MSQFVLVPHAAAPTRLATAAIVAACAAAAVSFVLSTFLLPQVTPTLQIVPLVRAPLLLLTLDNSLLACRCRDLLHVRHGLAISLQ